MAPLISFVGYHNSGKTTFARKVIGELKKKGYRVGVIKSTHHTDIEESPKGKDTQLYISDGVESVALITPEKVYFEGKIDNNPEYIAFKLFEDFDLVVCEGFKKSPLPKIEVARKEISDKTLFERGEIENVIAVVSDFPVKGIKNFSFEQSREVAELIEEEFLKLEIKIKELKDQLEDEEFIKQEAKKSLERKKARAKEKEKEKNSSLLNKNF